MKEYHKIQTILKRDPTTNNKRLLEGQFSEPEFEFLRNCQWIGTEKIDGTNIRVMWDGKEITFGGKTDNAQIPATLVRELQLSFPVSLMSTVFPDPDEPICLYGEGYGAKIQRGGNYIPDGVDFILFDVKISGWWLKRDSLADISKSLDTDLVPIVYEGSLVEAIDFVKHDQPSTIGTAKMEGLVLKPAVELTARNGNRIITKIKRKDFA